MPKAKEPPVITAINAEGDTRKVDRSRILFNWQVKKKHYTLNDQGVLVGSDPDIEKGNYELFLPEVTRDYFNIPKYTPAAAAADEIELYKVRSFTYKRYKTIADTSGVDVSVREHWRKKPPKEAAANLQKNHVVIPLLERKTAKGNYRTVSLVFPTYFSVSMMCQAIGTALANCQDDRKPVFFLFQGRRELIPYGAPVGAPMTNLDNGAWIATAEIEPTQYGGNTALASSAGERDGTTTGGGTP